MLQLEESASYMEKMLEQFFQKLAPIVAPVPAQNEDVNQKDEACLCATASRIQNAQGRVHRAARAVELMLNMVEI